MAFTKWFSNSWFSCKRYSQRASKSLDEKLSMRDWLGFRFHHYLCGTCRRFRVKLLLIDENLKALRDSIFDPLFDPPFDPLCETEIEAKTRLSEEASERIKRGLKVELGGRMGKSLNKICKVNSIREVGRQANSAKLSKLKGISRAPESIL